MVNWESTIMVLEWREQEHEDMDRYDLRDGPIMQVLQQSGLLNFFCTSIMRANVHLLEHLINYWDHDLGVFDLEGEILEVAVEDMCFITGLSRRGMSMNLEGTGRDGDPMSVQDYVDTYCPPSRLLKGIVHSYCSHK